MSVYKKMVIAFLYLLHLENMLIIKLWVPKRKEKNFTDPYNEIVNNILSSCAVFPEEWFNVNKEKDNEEKP